jgi:NADPH:quinone reductase-like Zn-dependent oxidoreductase
LKGAIVTQPFTGLSCLVTGAGSGIGAATAELLALRGALIVAVGLPADPLKETLPVKRVAEPEEMALGGAYLLSPEPDT